MEPMMLRPVYVLCCEYESLHTKERVPPAVQI